MMKCRFPHGGALAEVFHVIPHPRSEMPLRADDAILRERYFLHEVLAVPYCRIADYVIGSAPEYLPISVLK